MDGKEWKIEITLSNGQIISYSGGEAKPPYWAELMTTFRPFFDEAGVKNGKGKIPKTIHYTESDSYFPKELIDKYFKDTKEEKR